MHVDYKVF